jgi:hypothetical protein
MQANVSDLSVQIEQLLDLIQGNITQFTTFATVKGQDGGVNYRDITIGIYANDLLYYLCVGTITSNASDRKEVGITWLKLFTGKPGQSDYKNLYS